MKTIKVFTKEGVKNENLYTIEELPLLGKLFSCKDSKKRRINYIELACAFDIETTNIYEKDSAGNIITVPRPYAFMYHWQFCIDDCVCFGRTWEEFQDLLKTLEKKMNLSYNNRLVVWVHNLSFEWCFMNHFIEYEEGFFKEEKKPLKILTKGGIEFRDSYALSNMSLNKFCENEGAVYYKLDGDEFDYSKIRTPQTTLTEYEQSYCYNDVRGLCECIRSRMRFDTLATMPMTATGYVRRDLRQSVRGDKKYRELFRSNALDKDLYLLCREAFRGGDTHANIHYSNQLLHDVTSKDIASSYPASMMMGLYPQTKFMKLNASTYLNNDLSDYALLMEVRLSGVRYIGQCGIPYIAVSKCRALTKDAVKDNGRVLYASMLELVCTDIDFEIIKKEYEYTDIFLNNIYASKYAPLSPKIKNVVMDYFRAKTTFKGDPEHEYEYNRKKVSLNSTYGCMVMRIDQEETVYNPDTFSYEVKAPDLEEMLAKFYKSRNNFLSYQHGIWITANSRKRLRDMLNIVAKDVVYCDTDSIKYKNNHDNDFDNKNKILKEEAIKAGAYAETKSGKIKYMGIWEDDGNYSEFKTLGAKKYVYKEGDKIKSTIAGVSKKAGAAYFSANGIDSFNIGTILKDSGHLTAFYNNDDIHQVTVKGVSFTSASNVALIDNNYTIGVTGEYLDLLEKALDNMDEIEYI